MKSWNDEEFDNINPSKLDTSTPPIPRPYNVGFLERSEAVSSSKPFESYSRLHVDAFNTDQLPLNLVDIKIKKQNKKFILFDG